MKARTKHLENNSTTGLLKASPTFLGKGFFSTPTIFFSRWGLYQTAQPRAVEKGLRATLLPQPSTAPPTSHKEVLLFPHFLSLAILRFNF